MKLRCQRGQGLVETALAAPLLVLLALGSLQLGQLCWWRVKLQAAAQAAARAYTVWQPEDEALALQKARRSVWQSLKPLRGLRSVRVELLGNRPGPVPLPGNDLWLNGSLMQHLKVEITLDSPIRIVFPDGLRLSAVADILNEDSLERAAAG